MSLYKKYSPIWGVFQFCAITEINYGADDRT